MNRLLALFQTTRGVIRADHICKQKGIVCKIIPVPRELSSECGMALEFDFNDEQIIRAVFDKEQIVTSLHYPPLTNKKV